MSGHDADTSKSHQKILFARDYQSLSLFRILLALFLAYDFFVCILPHYSSFFTDQGLLPRPYLVSSFVTNGALSLLTVSDYWPFHMAFIAVHILALLAFAVGYKTRGATIVLFITYASMFWRNPAITSGAEVLTKLFLLWSMFLPLSRYWGVDAALDPAPRDRFYPAAPFITVKAQIAFLYFFSALYKLAGEPWRDGTAIGMALKDNMFGATAPGLWFFDHFSGWLCPLTYGIIVFQLLFTLLIYCPWFNNFTRGIALLGAACMHISFIVILRIGLFPYICLIYLVLLIPDEWWNALLAKRRARLKRIRIFYDPECEFCKKTALLFREFCLPFTVPVLPASQKTQALVLLRQNNSWVVYNTEGKPLMHWRGVAYVLKQNPFLWIFGAVTDSAPLRPLVRIIYDWIGAHRPLWGKLTKTALPIREQPALGPCAAAFCAALGLLALTFAAWDTGSALAPLVVSQPAGEKNDYAPPVWLTDAAAFFQVLQRWDLFAPDTTHWQRRYTLTGIKADGTTTDLAPLWLPPLFSMPDNYRIDFGNLGMGKYLSRLEGGQEIALRFAFLQYVCRQANAAATDTAFAHNVHLEIIKESEDETLTGNEKPAVSMDFPCPPTDKALPGVITGQGFHAF